MTFPFLPIFCLLTLAACTAERDSGGGAPATLPFSVPPDSATSMTYLLREFQKALPARPERLTGASASREALVERFLGALERGDAAALEAMRVSPVEFAHLYFPESIFMRPPYELDPRVVWMQIDAASNTGLRRAVQRHAGARLRYVGLICQPPQAQGIVVLHGCDVRRLGVSGDTLRDRMFGAILERAGQFKFLSLENRM